MPPGAFVELEEGIDGMVHVSDLSWTRKINHPSEVLKKGDSIEAVVIDIDKANQRIALGVKQLDEDPWKEIDRLYKIGDLVKGKVTKLAKGFQVETRGGQTYEARALIVATGALDGEFDVAEHPVGVRVGHQQRSGLAGRGDWWEDALHGGPGGNDQTVGHRVAAAHIHVVHPHDVAAGIPGRKVKTGIVVVAPPRAGEHASARVEHLKRRRQP